MSETAGPGYHREEIKAMVRMRGSTLRKISIEAGLHKGTASLALLGPVPKGNRAIASFLGMNLSALWPQWYDAQGHRIRKKRSPAAKSRQSGGKSHEKFSTRRGDVEGSHV